jgi:cell division protein FtsQ
MQQGTPLSGRSLDDMPLEAMNSGGADAPRSGLPPSGMAHFGGPDPDAPPRPWWRPASRAGRIFLALAALAVLGSLCTAGYLLKSYLGRDARFRIAGAGNIEATGLTEVSRAEMLPVFGEDIGRNIFFVPLSERRRQLEQLPWVEHATVMRFLPDQIRVSIVERQPVAFVRQGAQIGLADASGMLLTMPAAMMAQHHYSFPVVTGLDARDPQPSRRARMAVYGRLLAELDSNGQRLSEQISEIDLTDPEDARVLMPEPGSDILAHFGNDQFLERYQRYKAHIGEWRQQYPKLAAVDLRYDSQVVLEMTPGTGGAATAATGPGTLKPGASKQGGSEAAKPSAAKPVASTANEPAQKAKRGTASAKAKPASKGKAVSARDKKKRAQADRAALNASKQKPSPKLHPAPPAVQAQKTGTA